MTYSVILTGDCLCLAGSFQSVISNMSPDASVTIEGLSIQYAEVSKLLIISDVYSAKYQI
jgi:hypothetical protein